MAYTYDTQNRLLVKQLDSTGNGTFEEVERYAYDGANVILQLDDTDTVEHRYLQGQGIDQLFADENAVNDVLWALTDNQGTVRDWIEFNTPSVAPTVVEHLQYDAFGQITDDSNPSLDTRYAYTGREWDADAELYYYRARWYDPAVGSFISEDPLGFAAGDLNLIRYVNNAPVNHVDPTGTRIEQTSYQNSGILIVYKDSSFFGFNPTSVILGTFTYRLGDLDDEATARQKARLLEISGTLPVHPLPPIPTAAGWTPSEIRNKINDFTLEPPHLPETTSADVIKYGPHAPYHYPPANPTVSGGPHTLLTKRLAHAGMEMFINNHDLQSRMLNHYLYGNGAPFVLTEKEMGEIGFRIGMTRNSIERSSSFLAIVAKAVATGCAPDTSEITFKTPSVALLRGTLGNFTTKFRGTLTASGDGKWKFKGEMQFIDIYDFNSAKRQWGPELQVRTFAFLTNGTPYTVISPWVDFSQDKGGPGRWSGANMAQPALPLGYQEESTP